MNPVADELNDILMHYGMPRRSGRYPWGSGDDPFQRTGDFLSRVEELRKQGFTYTDEKTGKTYSGDTAIAKSMGLSTTQFRIECSLVKDERRMLNVAKAKSLQSDGKNVTEIGRETGVNESTVRSWLNAKSEARMMEARKTADFLKAQVDKKEMIDVGADIEYELNVSKEKLKQALYLLEREGYNVYAGGIPQATNPGQQTNQLVLCKPGIEHKEIYQFDRVQSVRDYITRDGGETFEKKFHYPESMDSKRLMIRYNEEGGLEKDGIVELRRGVDDLSLGESRYSQVRILVDGTHYIKGMAVYSDSMPDGVDVVFNTNKEKGTPMKDVLKKIKSDPDNPFGSAIKDADQGGQYWYTDKDGNKKLGLINKRADEGDWSEWKDALPSQFLAKQNRAMAKKQLDLAKADKLAEFEEICSINNPTIKKHFLEKFADSCDSAAIDLKAAALPGQKYHVIIPINSLKDTEVYAPRYENGTKLALIRYPHGGTFEIPILTVNNKHAAARKLLDPSIEDAVGVTSKVAERLSGADFDGDTVMCIPTHDRGGKVKVTSTPPLKGLENFDPKTMYRATDVKTDADGTEHYYRDGREFRIMTKKGTQTQMGIISNLITDMTLAGASDSEKAAAVRHSMVVIDAAKHKLDYKQSELDNNIAALHLKYQGKTTGGAATILSRSKGQQSVVKRKGSPNINEPGKPWYDPTRPEGALVYKTDPKATYEIETVNPRTGKVTVKTKTSTQKSTKMGETDDAYTLVSKARHPMEIVYADYANSMKALANQARKEIIKTGNLKYSASAKEVYAPEVASLGQKLKDALLNAPKERAAQRMAAAEIKAKKEAGMFEDASEEKKARQKAITKYREEVGSATRKKRNIFITDREWAAIQAGAISENQLKKILSNADTDELRKRATPKASTTISTSKISRIKAYSASGYTLQEIADKLGVSKSTVSQYLKGGN